jgi:hypothetical protein
MPAISEEVYSFYKIAERQAQLPRARVEVRKRVAKNGRTVVKRNAWRLGVSCSVLFGSFEFYVIYVLFNRWNCDFYTKKNLSI